MWSEAAFKSIEIASEDVDLVHFDSFKVARYVHAANSKPTVLVPYDAFSLNAARNFAVLKWSPESLRALWQMLTFGRLERRTYPLFSRVAATSGVDADWLRTTARLCNVDTLGIPVAPEFFERMARGSAQAPRIVVMGVVQNAAIRVSIVEWFRHVYPNIRGVLGNVPVVVWGRGASSLADHEVPRSVARVQEVANYREYLQGSTVLVYPQRSGAGIQTKIQQAMASRVPVVARSVTTRPLGAQHGVSCFECDDNASMCDAVVTLWRDASLRARMGVAAARLIQQRYSLSKVADTLELIYRMAATGRPAA